MFFKRILRGCWIQKVHTVNYPFQRQKYGIERQETAVLTKLSSVLANESQEQETIQGESRGTARAPATKA